MLLALNDRIVMDTLGDEVLALDGDNGVVHRLTGPIAGYALSLRDGTADLADDDYTRALIDAGIAVEVSNTEQVDTSQGITRRSALGVLVGASAGAATLLLPSAADAVSVGGGSSETTLPQGPGFGSSPYFGSAVDSRYGIGANSPTDDYRQLRLAWGQTYSGGLVTSNPQSFNWTVSGSSPSVYMTGTVGPGDNGSTGFFTVPGWADGQTLTITLELIPADGSSPRTVTWTVTAPTRPPEGPGFGTSPNYGTRLDTRYVEGSNPPVDDYRELQIRWGQTYSGDTVTSNPQSFSWSVAGTSPAISLSGSVGPSDNGRTGYFEVPNWAQGQQLTVTLVLVPADGYAPRTVVRTITGPANPNG